MTPAALRLRLLAVLASPCVFKGAHELARLMLKIHARRMAR